MLEEQISIIPTLDGPIAKTISSCLSATKVGEVKAGHGESILNVCYNRLLDRLSITTLVLAHQLPYPLVFVVIDFILHIFRLLDIKNQLNKDEIK